MSRGSGRGKSAFERFLAGIDIRTGNECWPWTRSKSYGYGALAVPRVGGGLSHVRAHRFAYECFHGPIPDGLLVCHACDNPPCCNPSHLFLGTPRDNVIDCVTKNRRAKKRGHYNTGAKNSHSKFTNRQIEAIKRQVANGASQTDIAKQHGVNKSTIWRLVRGRTWIHA